MSKWQPIETAPRDGTEILCFVPNNHKRKYQVCNLDTGFMPPRWRNTAQAMVYPEYWMPLPDPPESEE